MALSFDDKLLGEKVHNYCSSSSESDGEGDSDQEEGHALPARDLAPPPATNLGCNTGPKGVINDWRQYKKLEAEKREEQEQERLALFKKLSITCRTQKEDDMDKQKEDALLQELEEMEDEFLKEYRQKRLEELKKTYQTLPMYGEVLPLNKENYIDAIDNENPYVTIVIHLYEDGNDACESMNGCLRCIAEEYRHVKFCKLRAAEVNFSQRFRVYGVPALLVYKNGEVIGNFPQLSKDFGEDFFASDVERFLVEHGMLPDPTLCPKSSVSKQPSN